MRVKRTDVGSWNNDKTGRGEMPEDGIRISSRVVTIVSGMLVSAMLGAYGWVWNVNSRVVKLETELAIAKDDLQADIDYVREGVDDIKAMLMSP